MVRQQVRTQFGYIEQDLNVPNLVAWWDLFADDYFGLVEESAQTWARSAIQRAAAPFEAARLEAVRAEEANETINSSHNPEIYSQVIGALEQMLQEVDNMRLPSLLGAIFTPQIPGLPGPSLPGPSPP